MSKKDFNANRNPVDGYDLPAEDLCKQLESNPRDDVLRNRYVRILRASGNFKEALKVSRISFYNNPNILLPLSTYKSTLDDTSATRHYDLIFEEKKIYEDAKKRGFHHPELEDFFAVYIEPPPSYNVEEPS